MYVGCVGVQGDVGRTSLPAACRPQPRPARGPARAYLAAGRAAGARGEPSASRARPSHRSRRRAAPPQRAWHPPPPPHRHRHRHCHRHRARVLLAESRPPVRRQLERCQQRCQQRCLERGGCDRARGWRDRRRDRSGLPSPPRPGASPGRNRAGRRRGRRPCRTSKGVGVGHSSVGARAQWLEARAKGQGLESGSGPESKAV